MSRARTATVAACSALAISLLALVAPAEPLDPAQPRVIAVGRARTPAPCDRLDPERTSQSAVALPERDVSEVARKSVGTLAHAPVVSPDGSVWVPLASAELLHLRLEAQGKEGGEIGRTRLGASPATRSPVVLPDGGVAVLTSAPSVVFVSPSGKLKGTVPLPRASFSSVASGGVDGFVSIAASEDGAVAIAGARSFLVVESSGRVRNEIELPERIASDLIPLEGGWLVVGESGKVHLLKPPAAPRLLGSLGPISVGTAVLDTSSHAGRGRAPRTLLALAYPNRVVSLDLKSGTTVNRVGDSAFSGFDAPFALAPDGSVWLSSTEGFLVGYDGAGAEVSRAAIDRNATQPGALFSGKPLRPAPVTFGVRPGPVVDREGRVAFARSGGRFGLRGAGGDAAVPAKIAFQTDRACTTPLALVPVAASRLLLACREGTLILYAGDAERAADGASP